MSRLQTAIRLALLLLVVIHASVFPVCGAESVASQALFGEWRRVQDSNYEALEEAPVRHWGSDDLQEPLRRIDRMLRDGGAAAEANAREQAREAYESIVETLMIQPVATIAFTEDGTPTISPVVPAVDLHRNVPSALVFRIQPGGPSGKLRLAAAKDEPFALEPQEVEVSSVSPAIAIMPIVARGPVGNDSLPLEIVLGEKQTVVDIRLNVRPSGSLRIGLTRNQDGTPITAKIYIEDSRGRLYVVPGEPNYQTQSWYASFQPRFSYIEGAATIPLPPGEYRVTAMKGYAYKNAEETVRISADETLSCAISLVELCSLEEAGWFSADMHVHGDVTLPMLRGEDVNVAAQCHYSSERPLALRVYENESDPTHLSCSAQEIEHWNFGNAFYFGIPTTVQDPETLDPRMTPFFIYDEQAHRMGGVTLRWLRAREFSPEGNGQQQPEIAVDAALGYMDIWSVLDNSMQQALDRPIGKWTGDGWGGTHFYERTYKTWYGLLNCGIRITASGGTSFRRLSRLGFNRVYARCPDGLSVDRFADALKQGDGFVTNGPLLWLRVEDRRPGDGLALDEPAEVRVSVECFSRHPVDRIEIVQNGKTVASLEPERSDSHIQWETALRVDEPCWIAARCFGTYRPRYPHSASHNHFAHTNPLFVTIDGRLPSSPGDAARFLKEIDALIEFVPEIPSEDLRKRSRAVFEQARKYYAEMSR